jgi:hypothetical protein
MAKDKTVEPVVTTWIPEPHDHSAPAEVVVEPVEDSVSE